MEIKQTDNTKSKKKIEFNVSQILSSKRYEGKKDILCVLLDAEEKYTFDEVDKKIDKFMKGKVN